MTTIEYLQKVLKSQQLAEDSDELKELREHREKVEALLTEAFSPAPSIRYGGSKSKGTMIREAYDLDLLSYFPHDDDRTLAKIYEDTATVLEKDYIVERKTSALRLRAKNLTDYRRDLRIDVVPGRYFDASMTDVWLYQASADKQRQKTNPDIHIAHVRESGVRDAIKLMKLWAHRNGILIKSFVLELLTIRLLQERKTDSLDEQLRHVWTKFHEEPDSLSVKDPANPEGNDLTPALDAVRATLATVAGTTLTLIETSGWEAVFGPVNEDEDEDTRLSSLKAAAVIVTRPSKPWGPE